MAERSAEWKALVERWDEITVAYESDRDACRGIMRDVLDGVRNDRE